jgi:hypothetical protein
MARELKAVVVIGTDVYGPGYINPPPDDVAKTITSPAAWGEAKESDDSEGSPQGEEPVEAPVVAAPGDGDVTSPDSPEPTPPPSEPAKPTVPVPPRSGAGSGVAAWRAFADANDVDYSAEDSRDEIIEACEKAKVI